jgi:hypothetical protein
VGIKQLGIVPEPKPGEPNQEIIDLLERVLEEARAGKIEGIAIATVEFPSRMGSMWNAGPSWLKLLGSVTALQHALVNEIPDDN